MAVKTMTVKTNATTEIVSKNRKPPEDHHDMAIRKYAKRKAPRIAQSSMNNGAALLSHRMASPFLSVRGIGLNSVNQTLTALRAHSCSREALRNNVIGSTVRATNCEHYLWGVDSVRIPCCLAAFFIDPLPQSEILGTEIEVFRTPTT